MKLKALFLDLDGTIITTKSKEVFPINYEDWKFIDGVKKKIRAFYELGYKIIIVSNQGGIQLKYLKEAEFILKITQVCTELEKSLHLPENYIAYTYCAKLEDYNRKPNPGMAYEMALEYELNLAESIMIGDREEDKNFAINAGIGTFVWANDFVL